MLDGVVDSVTQKVLISDTTLRSFITPKVHKMTPRLHQICGCELCIIPKDIPTHLNRFRTRIVTDLQYKFVGRHTCNSAFITTSNTHYKEKRFADGGFLHATIKDAAQCISCTPFKTKNVICINCALGFYENWPEYIIPDEGLYSGPNDPLIHFSFFTYQGRCAKHGIIPNGATLCKIYKENDVKIMVYSRCQHVKIKNTLPKWQVKLLNFTWCIISQH